MAELVKKTLATKSDNENTRETTTIVKPSDESEVIDQFKNRELRSKIVTMAQQTADARKRYDWEWLTRDLFRRGYQFSAYNPATRHVILTSNSQIKIPINLVWAQMRVIRNQVTAFRPKWEVLPTGKNESSLNNARYSGKLLDYYYDRLGLRKMIKETVTQGLMYSVGGPWQIIYDKHANKGEGEVTIHLWDTYDFYVDMNATSIDDAEYCYTAARRPLTEVKTNPDFKFYQDFTMGENRQAQSEYKQFLLQALKYHEQTQVGENDSVILKEFWWKTRVSEQNMQNLADELKKNDQDHKELKVGEVLMRVVHYLDILEDPLKVQLLRRSDYPFEMYQADINPVELYGESWIKHVIPANRVLNALESSIFQYHYKYAKGRIVIDKNSGVRMINNEHGSIIEKNKGAEVSALHLAPLPQSYNSQIENMRRYIEDLGGAHDISMGRIPAGIKSGVGLAELKQADSNNQTDLVDNLEDFMIRVGKKVLREIAENYDVPRVIKALGKSGDAEHFAVIGEKGGKNRKKKDVVRIGPDEFNLAKIGADNEISVKIGSWLAYTKTAQQEKLRELFEAGVIDQKSFLEHLEFNDVQNIVEKTREATILEKMSSIPAAGAGDVTDMEIAEQENVMMTKDQRTDVVPLPTDAHSVHIAIHQDKINNPAVEKHVEQHIKMMRSGGAPNQSQAPVQPAAPQAPQPEGGQPVPIQPDLPPEIAAMLQGGNPMGASGPLPTGPPSGMIPMPGAVGMGSTLPPAQPI